MAKTKEELEKIKKDIDILKNKLSELNEDELKEINVGVNIWDIAVKNKDKFNNK